MTVRSPMSRTMMRTLVRPTLTSMATKFALKRTAERLINMCVKVTRSFKLPTSTSRMLVKSLDRHACGFYPVVILASTADVVILKRTGHGTKRAAE